MAERNTSVRGFGLVGAVIASGYFYQGLTLLPRLFTTFGGQQPKIFFWRLAVVTLDLFFGAALAIAAAGLLFAQGWAKKMWLLVASVLALTHLVFLVFAELGQGNSTFYLVWTWMLFLTTALSWWYFTRTSPDSREVTPANSDIL